MGHTKAPRVLRSRTPIPQPPGKPAAAAAFYRELPQRFQRSRRTWEKPYNELIYTVHRPLTRSNVEDVVTWLDGGKLGDLGKADLVLLNETLSRIHWPDVRPLAKLRSIEGMTLPRAAALMHFANPSFPTFNPEAVRGLGLLGVKVRRGERLGTGELRAYRRYLEAITALREAAPYRAVPESHYFHSWVLEQGLRELAKEAAR